MKNIKKLLFTLVMVMTFTVISPSVMTGQTTTVQAAVKLNKKKVTLIKGQTATLKISGTKKKVKWSSNKKSVATVTQKGKITAKKTGAAKITAKIGNKKYTCTVKVQAPKLSKTKVTITAGKKYTLKLTGTDQKITWKSSKASVASVNSKGVITAKNAGTAKITATVLKKKYTCTVTVKKNNSNVSVEKFDAEKAKKNIDVKLYDTGHGVVAAFKNNTQFLIYLRAKLIYYKNESIVGIEESDVVCAFESGRKCYLPFDVPMDKNYNYVDYDDYKVSLYIEEETSRKGFADKIKLKSNKTDEGIMVEVTNNSSEKLYAVTVSAIYYDEKGNVIGTDYAHSQCYEPGSIDYVKTMYPYDENYEVIVPYRYEMYVNYAWKNLW